MSDNLVIDVVADESEAVGRLARLLEDKSKEAIQARNEFTVGLSGGSLVSILTQCLPSVQTDWNPESTFGCYREHFIARRIIPVTEGQFVKVDASLPVEKAAEDYEAQLNQRLQSEGGRLRPDLLLLGMGPDGHTASLFPGHPLLIETTASVAPISDSPKPPPSRVTLTFPVINNARNCVFTVIGQGKSEMIKNILKDKKDLPAGHVSPVSGKVLWIVDKAAASLL